MFDFHNHFTSKDSILKTGSLLPQNYKGQDIESEIYKSEIGLDKRYVCIMNKENQIELFEQCLELAKQKSIPVHIHCVGYTNETILLIKKYNLEPFTVMWHRFNGSYETAKVLYRLGVIISIANDYSKDIALLYNSNKNLVLETDYEGTSSVEHDFLINSNYKRTAEALGVDVKSLEAEMLEKTKRVRQSHTL